MIGVNDGFVIKWVFFLSLQVLWDLCIVERGRVNWHPTGRVSCDKKVYLSWADIGGSDPLYRR